MSRTPTSTSEPETSRASAANVRAGVPLAHTEQQLSCETQNLFREASLERAYRRSPAECTEVCTRAAK